MISRCHLNNTDTTEPLFIICFILSRKGIMGWRKQRESVRREGAGRRTGKRGLDEWEFGRRRDDGIKKKKQWFYRTNIEQVWLIEKKKTVITDYFNLHSTMWIWEPILGVLILYHFLWLPFTFLPSCLLSSPESLPFLVSFSPPHPFPLPHLCLLYQKKSVFSKKQSSKKGINKV